MIPDAASKEIVHRPEAGLARGLWEASPVALYVAAAALVASALLYLAVRMGVLRRRPRGGGR